MILLALRNMISPVLALVCQYLVALCLIIRAMSLLLMLMISGVVVAILCVSAGLAPAIMPVPHRPIPMKLIKHLELTADAASFHDSLRLLSYG
jgi:hypothetical protein